MSASPLSPTPPGDQPAGVAPDTEAESSTAASAVPDPRRRWRRRLAGVGGLVLLGILLGGCKLPTFYGYRGVTSQSHDESLLYEGTVIAAIVVGVITGSLIIWSALRYRRKSDTIPRQFQYHIPLEIFYTVVPIVIVLALFGFTVYTENKIDNVVPNPALNIRVTAFQWGWRYDYTNYHVFVEGVRTEDPDPVGLDGKTCVQSAPTPNDCLGPGLVMPVGETVRITLLSNDVVHGFYVPQFNFSRYALPGVVNRFDFNVQKPGIYRAQCTQLCGLYHAEMFFHVVALPRAQFLAWVHGSQPQPIADAGPIPTAAQSAKAVVPPPPAATTKSSAAS
ncbi:cytochrome c oxidase subunit II [Aciditerrimonas ferrireducens]|uniref:cytochrome-c oxidase n=1 Tax=Aciditerrimonas ferrireducens TaxID=667306 RepID=A0ABV6C0U8_9ACTN